LLLRKNIFGKHPWFKILLLAFLSCAAPFTLIAFTEIYLTTSMGSILNATTPIYAALLSLIILKEKSHYSQYIGFLLGIIGVIILVGFEPMAITSTTKWAVAAILLATFFYACGGIYAAKTFTGFPPVVLVFWQQLFSFIILFPFAIYEMPAHFPSKEIIFSVLSLGVLCTGLAFLLYFHLIKVVGASKTLTVAYIIPIFGMLWGHLFLGEKIGPTTILGAFTILLGVYLIYRKRATVPVRANVLKSEKYN
jgi:drug/metabolite transporter (DMT)-like permease